MLESEAEGREGGGFPVFPEESSSLGSDRGQERGAAVRLDYTTATQDTGNTTTQVVQVSI